MNLGGGRYRKLSLRSEQHKRWAKMRAENTLKASAPAGRGAKLVTGYFTEGEERQVNLKKAGVAALVFHFMAFLLIFPVSELEVVPLDRTSATVVKRYTPPAPPAKAKKTRKKKTSTPIPIPDPTPDDPEPIEPGVFLTRAQPHQLAEFSNIPEQDLWSGVFETDAQMGVGVGPKAPLRFGGQR